MAAQEILQLGSEILRQKAKRVPKGMRGLRKLTDKMFATMDAAAGIGLAAPQIGVSLRVIVVDADEVRMALVNPEIVKTSEVSILDEEGCLSYSSYYGPGEPVPECCRQGAFIGRERDTHSRHRPFGAGLPARDRSLERYPLLGPA